MCGLYMIGAAWGGATVAAVVVGFLAGAAGGVA